MPTYPDLNKKNHFLNRRIENINSILFLFINNICKKTINVENQNSPRP